jgi:hypothetical protein
MKWRELAQTPLWEEREPAKARLPIVNQEVSPMTVKDALVKACSIFLAVCFAGIAATAAAQSGGDKQVDCDKTPSHPDCQAKK